MKKLPAALAAVLTIAVPSPHAEAGTTTCDTAWGSRVEVRSGSTGRQVTDVRSGRHACFDRLVVDINAEGAGRSGFRVKYVARVASDGSGAVVPLRGGARIRIVLQAPAYDEDGEATYLPGDPSELVDVSGFDTFRQVAWAGTFEGDTSLGLGVRARLPMRAFVLTDQDGGARLVVDVAHRW